MNYDIGALTAAHENGEDVRVQVAQLIKNLTLCDVGYDGGADFINAHLDLGNKITQGESHDAEEQ